ncbi:CidA/LrgA family protein, partial [Thioclava sp. BHET1]
MRPLRHLQIRAQAFLHHSRFAQIALILLIWQLGDAIARLTGLPVPGSIVALVLLLGLLA